MNEPVAITSLELQDPPTATDILLVVVAGVAKKILLGDIRAALDVATTAAKGLMSATDKETLNQVYQDLTSILNPFPQNIAITTSINVPTNVFFVVLTGAGNVASISGLVNNRPVWFYYPAGAGLTFQGMEVRAGDPPFQVIKTA